MMLKASETQYLDICIYKANQNATIDQCCQEFGVSATKVNAATRWGEKHQVFDLRAAGKLDIHIVYAKKMIAWLESERDITLAECRDDNGKRVPLSSAVLRTLSSVILEWTDRLAKLEGAFEEVINLKVDGEIRGGIVIVRSDQAKAQD